MENRFTSSDAVRDRPAAEMSGGQQQRVAIAAAIANDPAVLLADESTGELDEATSAEVLGAMRRVNEERGVTTLIVTHDATVSDQVRRTVQIRDGRRSTEVVRSTRVDELSAELLVQLVRTEGIAAVVATHDPDLAARADRVIELHDGRIVQRQGRRSA
jgi:ABC-type lipoprotein export system ATPase subunit